jgi:hypothetical protein
MAQCAACGAETGAENKTCPQCGAALAEPTAEFEPVGAPSAEPKPSVPASDSPVLVVRKGPQPGERFFVDRSRLTVGRDPESDIFLNDMTVSRTHAIIECEANAVTVKDAGSLNGTYVNGEIVESATLVDGDALQIGTFQMVFISGTGAA